MGKVCDLDGIRCSAVGHSRTLFALRFAFNMNKVDAKDESHVRIQFDFHEVNITMVQPALSSYGMSRLLFYSLDAIGI